MGAWIPFPGSLTSTFLKPRTCTGRAPHGSPRPGRRAAFARGWTPKPRRPPSCTCSEPNFILQKMFIKSFCKNRFPHRSVNLLCRFMITKYNLTDLCENWLQQNDFYDNFLQNKIDSASRIVSSTRWNTTVSFPPNVKGNVTKFARPRALKVITWGKLTFDEWHSIGRAVSGSCQVVHVSRPVVAAECVWSVQLVWRHTRWSTTLPSKIHLASCN